MHLRIPILGLLGRVHSIALDSILPTKGGVNGGAMVYVTGIWSYFSVYKCKFDTTLDSTAALHVSDTVLSCVAPAHAGGLVDVAVCTNDLPPYTRDHSLFPSQITVTAGTWQICTSGGNTLCRYNAGGSKCNSGGTTVDAEAALPQFRYKRTSPSPPPHPEI